MRKIREGRVFTRPTAFAKRVGFAARPQAFDDGQLAQTQAGLVAIYSSPASCSSASDARSLALARQQSAGRAAATPRNSIQR